MEANLASRHVCKLCNKSFACGRSLGGHMRSHLTNNLVDSDEKHSRTSLQFADFSAGSVSNMEEEEVDMEGGNLAGFGYGLRKNPKKTQKLEFLSEESSLQDKFCRECGKGFQSWKALFGHMKCHSERVVSSSEELEEPDSHITDAKQKLVMDIQSDNETEAPKNKRKRSRRRRTAQMGTENSITSFSFATDSSVFEIQQEQEVAISLMLLSMDVGKWVGFNSPVESSDNNSKFLDTPSAVESKTSVSNKLKVKKMESEVKKPEQSSSAFMNKGKMIDQRSGSKSFPQKNDQNQARFSSDMIAKSGNKTLAEFWDSKICKKPKKRSKFECDICNKIFHSYQALGGHRASHKKLKGCFVESAMEDEEEEIDSESSAEMAISAYPTAESKLSKGLNNGEMGYQIPKKSSKHKCPICEKVFASGQALGGHKRSHLISGSEAKNRATIQIQKQVPEIRRFLDLNLPPEPVEIDNKNHNLASLKHPWWAAANEHKHEALVNVGFHI
ncbi:zinc finger protein ZAT4-like [Cucurbita maxima]|uniref:Zinc finger protein ZAT4-like n=1 Tax=Cucurbita maxima TaxID=3661 RepID=A0A6J1JGV1_CUCMA|nr:zinc finger protein ZAT4-like [Cucurbita maxima]